MPSVEELLSVAEVDANTRSAMDSRIEIDADTRIIQMMPQDELFGVESDEKSERKYFKVPKIVGNGVDLSKLQLRINYQNASKIPSGKDMYIVTDATVYNDEWVYFSWELSRKVTQYKGNIYFIVCAVKADSKGNITNEWNTTLAEGKVLEGLEIETSQEQQYQASDYLEQLKQQLLDYSKEIKDTFPSDYTQMQNDIGSLKEDLGKLSGEIVNVENGFIKSDLETDNFGLGADSGAINNSSYTSYIIPIKKGILYHILVTGSETEFIRMGTNKVGCVVGEKVTLQKPSLIDNTHGFLYEWICTNDDNYLLVYATTRTVSVKEKAYETQVIKDLSYYGNYSDGDNITEILVNAINSGNNIEIANGTYYVDKSVFELNNQIIKGIGVTFKNPDTGTYDTETSASYITFSGENFEIVGIKFDANGVYMDRPIHTSDTTEEYAEYLSNRHKTIRTVTILEATNFKISNCTFTNGVVGLRVDGCLDFVIEKCTVIYTNADSFFITNESARGVLCECVGCYNGDDTFSVVADSKNSPPNNIIVEKCIAHNTKGALACLHGSYNVIVDNCIGYNVGRCPLRLGSISASDGTNLRTGHNQTVSNCIIRCDNLCGGNEGADKTDNNFNSCLIQGCETEKTHDITINNVNIYRETNENNHILIIDKATNVHLIGCNFDKFDLSIIDGYKISVKSNTFKTTKYVKLKDCIDVSVIGNDFITDLGLWDGLEDAIFDPCNILIYNGYCLNFSGNKYLNYNANKRYNIAFHPYSESDEYEYHVDTDSVATYNDVYRQIKYDGIWKLSNSNLSQVLSALGDKQIVINANYKIYSVYNHEIKEVSTQ